MKEINICCPYFRTIRCSDTKEHRHIICKVTNTLISNSDTIYKCISENNFIDCEYFIPIKDN